jgi:hypothetical protein
MIEDLSMIRKFKSYYGLSKAMGKLERLMDGRQFIDLSSAEKQVQWDLARVVSL